MSALRKNVWTIVVAGGSGSRFGGLKQFAELSGRRMVDWAVETAAKASTGVVVVVPGSVVDDPEFRSPSGADHVVAGGSTRSESVRCGLTVVPADAEIICVHDAARPFASTELFSRVIDAIDVKVDAAIPGIEVTDTIKVVDSVSHVSATPDRASLRAVQTPQAFRANVLRAAHATGGDATDDAAVVEANGGYVVVVQGEVANRKITSAADLEWAHTMVVTR